MPSDRYWRINCTHEAGEDYVIIYEIEMRATIGGADQTSTSNTIFSSEVNSSNEAANAFDDTNSSRWVSKHKTLDAAPWIGQDFGSAQTIAEITIYTDNGDRPPSAIEIQHSPDNSTWTTTDTYSGLTWSSGETKTFAVSSTGESVDLSAGSYYLTGS